MAASLDIQTRRVLGNAIEYAPVAVVYSSPDLSQAVSIAVFDQRFQKHSSPTLAPEEGEEYCHGTQLFFDVERHRKFSTMSSHKVVAPS